MKTWTIPTFKIISLTFITILTSCGRPISTLQESTEVIVRQRQEVLSSDYKEVQGDYSGTLEMIDDGTIFKAAINLRVVQDFDASTGLPLRPKIVGSISIYEIINRNEDSIIATYGVTSGSFDQESNHLALEISSSLTVQGFANNNHTDGTLHSIEKGDIGVFKLVRQE